MNKYITIELSVPEVEAALRLAESLDPAKRSLGVKLARAWITTPNPQKRKGK